MAEDFLDPSAFLVIGDRSLFRPGFALPMMAIGAIVGHVSAHTVVYHAYSLLLHLAVVLALVWCATLLTGRLVLASLVATLFAIYPRNHEVVLWPAAAAHPMMALGLLLALALAIEAVRRRREPYRAASFAAFAVAMLSHEAAIILIPLLIVYLALWEWNREVTPLRAFAARALLWVAPYLAIVAGYAVLLLAGSSWRTRISSSANDVDFYHVILHASVLRDYAGYLSYAVVPFVELRSVDRSISKLVFLAVAIATLAAAALIGGRLGRFGVAWIVLTAAPFAFLVPFGNADRYFYLPAIGWSLVIVATTEQIASRLAQLQQPHPAIMEWMPAALVVVLYLPLAVAWQQDRIDEWRQSGDRIAQLFGKIHADHPRFADGTVIYVVGVPSQYRQARFMTVGVRTELRRHYQPSDIDVRMTIDPRAVDAVRDAPELESDPGPVVIYLYADGELVDRTATFGDPTVRKRLEELAVSHP